MAVAAGDFSIGGIDISTPVVLQNYTDRDRVIELNMALNGGLAYSKETDLEDAAKYAGQLSVLNPTEATPIYQDFSPGSQNTVEVSIGTDYIYDQNTPVHFTGLWDSYSADHDPRFSDFVEIDAIFKVKERL